MNKTIMIGTEDERKVYLKIKYKDKKLSISGVVGPYRNGNCYGSCGQIVDMITTIKPNEKEGWTKKKLEKLQKVWKSWHLNDMTPGCEHQQDWNTSKELRVIECALDSGTRKEQEQIKSFIERSAIKGLDPQLTNDEKTLLELPFFTHTQGAAPEKYHIFKDEIKIANWVSEDEHPEGVLSKPCNVCGYKYGSSWLHRDVPEQVINWLSNLQPTNYEPAWV